MARAPGLSPLRLAPDPTPGQRLSRLRVRFSIAAAVLVLATLVAYAPATRAGFIWDDDDYVTQSPVLGSFEGLRQIWFEPRATPQYYPLVHTTFWLEHAMWGLRAPGYHVTNILLHAACAVLLWRLLKKLELPGAWFAACVFALHPVHVESVAWVTERKNVLSLAFALGAMLTYFRLDGGEERATERPSDAATERNARNEASNCPSSPSSLSRFVASSLSSTYLTSLALFCCAMLSKTVACSVPAAIVLILWWKRGGLTRRDVLRLAPMFAIGLALGLVTVWLEKNHVGADGREWSLSFVERALIAGRAVWFYAGKIVWPARLTFIYPRWQIDANAAWQYAFPAAAMLLVAALFFLRNRAGRGPLVAALIFGGTLLPALGFFDVYPMRYSFVADHFQYAASIALIATLVALGAKLLPPKVAVTAACLVAVCLASLTFRQSFIYHDRGTLWRDTIAKNPDCWMAETNLAVYLHEKGESGAALAHARRSLAIKPDHAEAYNTLGVITAKLGRAREAAGYYEQALHHKPNLVSARINLGVLLARGGDPAAALPHFAAAAERSPRNLDAVYNWATANMQLGKLAEAELLYRRVLEIAPVYPRARLALAELLLQRGEVAEGMAFADGAVADAKRLGQNQMARDAEACRASLVDAMRGAQAGVDAGDATSR